MYIYGTSTYYKGTAQCARKAPFLILIQHKDKPIGPDNFRALVRMVAMEQCGAWMMGKARVKGWTLLLSGSYGSDGLPYTTDKDEVFEAAVPVPERLYNLWAHGEGWNSAGSEAQEMAQWARETFRV